MWVKRGVWHKVSAGELELGRLLAQRLRYRTNGGFRLGPAPAAGSAPRCSIDYTFDNGKVAAFYDGCYWHECPEHHPGSFGGKVQARDRRNNEQLSARGWLVIRVWEHESDLRGASERIVTAVRERRAVLKRPATARAA